eukprot:CAMPEP_0181226412 /NCGR_PEP_ID=MMETSP1096-20121128/32246_1 /TAXON_ID=156174 ORGANISM="Chrysochromulina ericina, Strain CCMP281" /NCGR_SAMPLE_ID=MMETSP1096 /ASSEMBLY_ACC=CAM_ASM_000453 /LENGTH=42 /DNA_ID= /DNA_START= /DNA_END= /DNA_ORIENTATION=
MAALIGSISGAPSRPAEAQPTIARAGEHGGTIGLQHHRAAAP